MKTGSGCWTWTAAVNAQGYGIFNRDTKPSRCVLAHRYAYESIVGPVPDDLCVLHRCDNPRCVRPNHLFVGTRTDNAADKVAKGRQGAPRCEGHPRARVTPELVREIRAAAVSCPNRSELHRRYKDKIGHTALRAILDRKTWKGDEYEPQPRS